MSSFNDAVVRLAGRQHGVVSAGQCLAAGMSRRHIHRRVASGLWRRVHPGVFAVVPGRLSHHGRYHAALLFAGADAALSHSSAASVWGLQPHHLGPVHVTIARKLAARTDVAIHWTRQPPAVLTRQGVRVTGLDRTLVDLADVARPDQMELAIRAAERLHAFDRATLRPIAGRDGAGRVHGGTLVRGNLAPLFLAVIDRAGFVAPETDVPLLGYEIDALWREQRIAVEVDDYETHANRDAMDADRARDRALTIAGFTPARVTYADLTDGVDRMLVDLAGLGVPRRVSG